MGEHRSGRARRLVGEHGRLASAIARLILIVLVVLAVLWVLVVLAFSSVLADPTSGSGEGRFPGQTVTSTNP